MKIGQKNVYKILDLAISNFKSQSPNLSWTNSRGEINFSERRVIAYLEAANSVLDLGLDIEYYKQVGREAYERVK